MATNAARKRSNAIMATIDFSKQSLVFGGHAVVCIKSINVTTPSDIFIKEEGLAGCGVAGRITTNVKEITLVLEKGSPSIGILWAYAQAGQTLPLLYNSGGGYIEKVFTDEAFIQRFPDGVHDNASLDVTFVFGLINAKMHIMA